MIILLLSCWEPTCWISPTIPLLIPYPSFSPEMQFIIFFSKLTVPHSLLPPFTSSPQLPTPFSVRMDALLSHSPFPHLHPLLFSTHFSVHPYLLLCFPWYAKICPSHLFSQLYFYPFLHLYRWFQIKSGTSFPVVSSFHTFIFPLPLESSIFTTEWYVTLFSLECMPSLPSLSLIFAYSKNSLSLIQSLQPISPLACKILNQLFHLAIQHKTVSFCWIPNHIGIPINEQADTLPHSPTLSTSHQLRYLHIPASHYYPRW